MSLKLGNTNIAGTQVLYSTTGSNTDGAMTQAATTTQLSLKANDTDVVHLTGTETITGTKIFAGDGWITKIQNTDVTYNIAPSSNKSASIIFTDKNGTQMGCVETTRYPSNDTLVRFNVYGANGNWASKALELMVDQNGNTTALAPASDVNGSIVTTINKSKAQNGYFQLGNGMIIQWGKGTATNSYTNVQTITLPKAFSNTNYSITFGTLLTAQNTKCEKMFHIQNKTTTTFQAYCSYTGGANNTTVSPTWIAIGY